MRGEVFRFTRRGATGHEQQGHRYGIVVHASRFDHLSTWIIAPTSTSDRAAPAVFRPEVTLLGQETRVMCEQVTAVDPARLGRPVAHLSLDELRSVDVALRLLLDLAP